MPTILHLVDDTTPGGVMRVIDHMTTTPGLTAYGSHRVQVIGRSGSIPTVRADIIVSHLSISWSRLPHLIAFRARHPLIPIIHVEHSYTEAFTAQCVPARGRFFTLLRTAFSLFDRVVAVSQAQGRWLEKRGLVRASSLRVIPSAVDLSPFLAVRRHIGPGRVVGGIGRLHRQKGFDILIKAFRLLPDPNLSLHIHGEGPEAAALAELAKSDTRIHFLGHAASPETVYGSVDLVAMPSRWEAFGLVAIEARAAGCQLVCADTDGLRESGEGARFVQGSSPVAWASALKASLSSQTTATSPDATTAQFCTAWSQIIKEILPAIRDAPARTTTNYAQ